MSNPVKEPVRLSAGQELFKAGATSALWRVLEGTVRLDRESGPSRLAVLIALPGDLVGIESLCDQPCPFTASAFTDCRLAPVPVPSETDRESLLREALFQQQMRSQDMATLRTGNVLSRLACLLQLLGLPWQSAQEVDGARADALRSALPALRELAQMVDAQAETVCRGLAQLLPPRRRKSGPVRAHPLPLVSSEGLAPWVPPSMAGGALS
ncbi:cyclic nucleotide-binding domain-containing protein [Hydrogenophaga pseudoflava]|uniref:cyclic nucleotide-binding domain-containing protein n=1 Tax=Hydrogenophaga pseudoflava TaxID=47421 RepID=UPI0027E48965|nr:cyclic nucleotide-binding domain-containing protein [Hydrogenophaga pseudoflava]MDQ7744903.1 cyclic nucleotide-binding domain-containing protein [Hydrogenophaga pseudoflava]